MSNSDYVTISWLNYKCCYFYKTSDNKKYNCGKIARRALGPLGECFLFWQYLLLKTLALKSRYAFTLGA